MIPYRRVLPDAIAHEYEDEALPKVHTEVLRLNPLLLTVPNKIDRYLHDKLP